jgi:PIN domain nuclease of toxin-antitoxin system
MFPSRSSWECSLLARAARINLRRSVQAFFADLFSNSSYQPVELTPDQVLVADDLRFTRDPFDAVICAAARSMELPPITNDAVIRQSGALKVIW